MLHCKTWNGHRGMDLTGQEWLKYPMLSADQKLMLRGEKHYACMFKFTK